jgi:pyruvate/2-oxoglutarate dehydrogenase complex dihydrolipoamide acyltransferase (E2) component
MWNHEHEVALPPGSTAARLFLGEPLRGATALSIVQTGGDAALALECGWECREYGHEPGPAGAWSQTLVVRFERVAGLRTMFDRAGGPTLGTLADARTKDTPWRRRTCAAWHFRVQTSLGVIDVLCDGVSAARDDGRPFAERLREPFPASAIAAARPDEAPALLDAAERGAWADRAEALTRLGAAGDRRVLGAARAGLAAAEAAVVAASVFALGHAGDLTDAEVLARLAPPPEAPVPAFRAHVEDAVQRLLERGGSARPK